MTEVRDHFRTQKWFLTSVIRGHFFAPRGHFAFATIHKSIFLQFFTPFLILSFFHKQPCIFLVYFRNSVKTLISRCFIPYSQMLFMQHIQNHITRFVVNVQIVNIYITLIAIYRNKSAIFRKSLTCIVARMRVLEHSNILNSGLITDASVIYA